MTLRDSTMQALGQALKDPAALEEVAENLNAIEGIAASEAAFIDGVVAGTAAANKAVVLGASKEIATLGAVTAAAITGTSFTGQLNYTTAARTATADGLTTAIIADAGMLQFITVTSANANNIIVLPTPTPGTIVILCNGGTGYELRSSAPATVAINGGSEADAESAIAASTMVIAVCKTATAWAAFSLVGTTLAAVEAAAAA